MVQILSNFSKCFIYYSGWIRAELWADVFHRILYHKPKFPLPSENGQLIAHYVACEVLWTFLHHFLYITLYLSRWNFTSHLSCVHSQSCYNLSLFFFFCLIFVLTTLKNNFPIRKLPQLTAQVPFWLAVILLCQVSSKSLLRGFVKNLMIIQNISVKTSLHICWSLLNMLVKKVSL